MDTKSTEALAEALRAEQARLDAQSDALKASGRADEANQKKAARNIYGLCEKLLTQAAGSAAFAAELDRMGEAWQQARRTAAIHGDFGRVAMEDIKLAALADVAARHRALEKEGTP